MQNLAEVITTYVRETRRLEKLPSSTETSFCPDLKLLLSGVLKGERLPFDVITGTSESGGMPDFVLGDSSEFVGVYGAVKRADTPLDKLAVSTERNDQIGRCLSQTASSFYAMSARWDSVRANGKPHLEKYLKITNMILSLIALTAAGVASYLSYLSSIGPGALGYWPDIIKPRPQPRREPVAVADPGEPTADAASEALRHVGVPIDTHRAPEAAADIERGLEDGVAGEAWHDRLEIRDFTGRDAAGHSVPPRSIPAGSPMDHSHRRRGN
jgi:hypothetical protein